MAGTVKSIAAARELMQKKLASGDALKKFEEMVVAQGGNPAATLPVAKHQRAIPATKSGYVRAIACDQIGYAVIALGGGRKVATDKIDFAVGFEQPKKIGDVVKTGEPLMVMHYNDDKRAAEAERMVQAAYEMGKRAPKKLPLVVRRIS